MRGFIIGFGRRGCLIYHFSLSKTVAFFVYRPMSDSTIRSVKSNIIGVHKIGIINFGVCIPLSLSTGAVVLKTLPKIFVTKVQKKRD